MSKEITNWIKEELYPALYEVIPQALPEMSFKYTSRGWRSPLKLYGAKPKAPRADKTEINKNSPGYIREWGEGALSLVDYILKRDGGDFIGAVKSLADKTGLQLPNFDGESYQRQKDKQAILEDANSYFIYSLETSSGAQDLKAYLSSRGYSGEDIKAMELGYIPDQAKLFKYLLSKGYSQSLIDTSLQTTREGEYKPLSKGIGSTHRLTIPYRSGGSIKGFKFRTIGDATTKYLNSTGLDKMGGFFNFLGIKGDKDVVIVEGELDSLSATAKGVENVVATGGNSISSEQVRDAIKRGAKSFTLCFDTERGKEKETSSKITTALEVILKEGVNRVYIVNLPESPSGKTDPDSLIKERGVEAFREAISQATPYYKYQLQNILTKYGTIQEQSGGDLTDKDKDRLLDEVVETGSKLSPMDRDQYKTLFISLDAIQELGITGSSYQLTIDRLTTSREKEAQAVAFKKLLSEATQLQDKGEVDKALDLLDERLREVKLKDKATEFTSLLIPTNEAEVKKALCNKPDSLNSGYRIGGRDLLLPSGALSIFSAPTSHGKTSLLINLSINVAEAYKDKQVYFFSYEEDKESILLKTLNTYVGKPLNNQDDSNKRLIKDYFTKGSTQFINSQVKEEFISRKDQFFKELIDTGRLSIHYLSYNSDTLREAIYYLHKNANPGAIFIDYFQLLNLPGGKYKTYSRQEELKQICINLKDIAVDTGLPIILGAQFNRQVESPLQLHPTKIGEAGDIERIANLLVGMWNGKFKPIASDTDLKEIERKEMSIKGSLWMEILKNRDGEVGLTESLSFDGNTGKIINGSSSGW